MDVYADSEVVYWWDFMSCPIPINCNPFSVLDNIQNALGDEGHHGKISIKAFGDYKPLPLSVGLVVSRYLSGYSTGTKMMEDMVFGMMSNHPPPATILLISGSDCFPYALKQLEAHNYKILTVKPRSALESKPTDQWLWRTWETLSTGGEDSYSSSIFDRNSILVVQNIFRYLREVFGRNRDKVSVSPTKKKTTVVIYRDEGSNTTTAGQYASYYKKMGCNPTIICADTSLAVYSLDYDPDGIPIFRMPTKRDHLPLAAFQIYIETCGDEYDLYILDIPIFMGDGSESDTAIYEKVYQVSKVLQVDFVFYAVQPSGVNISDAFWSVVGGLILNIEENITNKGREFLYEFITARIPIAYVQWGDDEFEACDVDRLVRLMLGACNFRLFVDDYALGLMVSYCNYVEEKRCSGHSNQVIKKSALPNEILMTAYTLWSGSETSNCTACSRYVNMAYPEI